MLESRKDDAPLFCPRCGGLCDMEIDEIRGQLATWIEPFVYCLSCPFVSELGKEGALLDHGGMLRLDHLAQPPYLGPEDFSVRRQVPARGGDS